MNRRSLFAALLGATAVKGAECGKGDRLGENVNGIQSGYACVDGKWVKTWEGDSRNMRTPPTVEDGRAFQLPGIRNDLPINSESLGCPFNHDWEKVPNAFLSYTNPNLVDESYSGVTYPIYIGGMNLPAKPNPPIPGVSRCKRCGVLGMPK